MSCMNDGIKDVKDFFSGIFTGDESKEIMEGVSDVTPITSSSTPKSTTEDTESTPVATASEDEPEREEEIDKTSTSNANTESCKRNIEKVYFAKKIKVGKDAGIKSYKFRSNNTITNKNKKKIAAIIKKRVKNGKKYTTIKEIFKVMSNKTYKAGSILSIPILTPKEVIKKIDKTNIGSEVYLVAETKGYKNGESVTLEIYEKGTMLVSESQELPFLKGKTQVTKVMATVKIDKEDMSQKAIVKITLRPKIDKKADDTSSSGSLESWRDKFKKENDGDEEKKVFLWIKGTSLAGKGEEKEFLKGSELEVSGSCLMSWMKIAKGEIGTAEIKGKKHSSRVLEYHKVSGGFSTDEVPWCGSFVNWVMKKSGHKTVSYPARAKSWKSFGKKIKQPIYGAIAVKSRQGGGHVAFVIGKSKDDKYLYVLGGNQRDSVNISKYKRSAWTDFRMPKDCNNLEGNLPIYEGTASKGGKES